MEEDAAERVLETLNQYRRDYSIPVVVAVDQSITYTACCMIFEEADGSLRYDLSKKIPTSTGDARYFEIGQWLARKLVKVPDIYAQEDYAYASSQVRRPGEDGQMSAVAYGTIIKLGELGGVLQYVAASCGCTKIQKIGIGQAKKFFTGKGNADKIAMGEVASAMFPGFDFPSNNEPDAIAIAMTAYALVKDHKGDTTEQAEVLHAIRHPEIAKQKKKEANARKRARVTADKIQTGESAVKTSSIRAVRTIPGGPTPI